MFAKFVLLFVGMMLCLSAQDYTLLKKKKEEFKQRGVQPYKKETVNPNAHYFIVSFYDINQMDTWKLEERYSLQLHLCIADGICIFKHLNADKKPLNINTILNEEPTIKKISEYKAYNFQTL